MDEQNNNSGNNGNPPNMAIDNNLDNEGNRKTTTEKDLGIQGNINHNADVPPVPSSPFEIRRHQSFYEGSTSGMNKRRGSTKSSSQNKGKQSTQILSFFRSQSHDPKPNTNLNEPTTVPIAPPAAKEDFGGGDDSSSGGLPAKPPQAKPRRARPQSLYSKTTTSKNLYVHRVSGIETTPESPETPETFSTHDFQADLVEAASLGYDPRNTTADESGDEGGTLKANGGASIIVGRRDPDANSCGQSSTSSSDSYISCDGESRGGTARRRNVLQTSSDKCDMQSYDGDDSCSPNSVELRQSGKHLGVGAPVMRTGGSGGGGASSKSGGEGSDTGLPPMTTSKSRQKKFHRHFKTVSPDEKVLDYYSCALVGDILLQGFLYITEGYFAFYSNVFGYVTKVLIPVGSVVRITKERTAKIFPNAVGVCTRTEKHVFASLISRDTTFRLMCKVWNFSIEQEAEEIRALQRRVAAQVEAEDAFSADVPVPDESSGDSGSGNDSAIEPSSHSPSPQNTPGFEKLVHAKGVVASIPPHLVSAGTVVSPVGVEVEDPAGLLGGPRLSTVVAGEEGPISIINYRGASHMRTSITGVVGVESHLTSASNAHLLGATASSSSMKQRMPSQQQSGTGQFRRAVRNLENNVGGRGPSLLMIATALLVILFLSAALLLSRISSLQQKLMERPMIHDSEQFYQDLLSWQTKLHSTTGEEIHQYINSNLQQIVKVRESLEALSMLFVNRPQQGAGSSQTQFGEASSSASILGGEGEAGHHPATES